MANEKNIGSVKASLDFDVSKAVNSLNNLSTTMTQHASSMTKFANSTIASMERMESKIDSGAKNISDDLKKISGSFNNTFSKGFDRGVGQLIDALKEQTFTLKKEIKGVSDSVDSLNGKIRSSKGAIKNTTTSTIKWFDATDSLFNSFSKITFKLFIIEQGTRQIYELFNGMVGPGFQFASSMETLRIGMAGILASTTKMGEEQTTYAQGLEISEKILKRMQVEALRTTMTVQELSEAYQSTLAGGLNAGMDLEQIMDLTVAAANAVKSFGLPKQQVIQELRGLISGEAIRPGVDMLGTVLGYTTATVNQLRKEGTLYEDIMKRMEGFKAATYDLDTTWAGMMNNMIDGFNKLAGSAVTGLFDNMKRRVKEMRSMFYSLKQEEHTYTNEKTGKQEKRTVVTDILINNETQKRLTYLYDTIDNFIELIYTLGKQALPFLATAFDVLLPAINGVIILLINFSGMVTTAITNLTSFAKEMWNASASVKDFLASLLPDEFVNFISNYKESIALITAFSIVGKGLIGILAGLGASILHLTGVTYALNTAMIIWHNLSNAATLGEFIRTTLLAANMTWTYRAGLIAMTAASAVAKVAVATFNGVLAVSEILYDGITTKTRLATIATQVFAKVTAGAKIVLATLSGGLLAALKAVGLFLAKITALSLAMAVLAAKFIVIGAAIGSVLYLFYKISDETSALSEKWKAFKDIAVGVWDGIANRMKYAMTGEEQYLKKSKEAFEGIGESWDKVKSSVGWDTALVELQDDAVKLKDTLKGVFDFKDIINPDVELGKLPKNIEAMFKAGDASKGLQSLQSSLDSLIKKYTDFSKDRKISGDNIKLAKKENEILKIKAQMYGGEMKALQEKEAKIKGIDLVLEEVIENYEKELALASAIGDADTRQKVIDQINKHIDAEKRLAAVQKEQAEWKLKFDKLQEGSSDIVTRVFGEQGELENKLAKNKELLTNFMAEIDALAAGGMGGKGKETELLDKGKYTDEAKSMLDKILTTSPEKLLEEYEKKKTDFSSFADFIKTKLAETSKAWDANTRVQEAWKEKGQKMLDDMGLGMGDAVYAWVSGAQDIGQAMRDMVQELLRNALKLILQWYTIFGIVSAFSGPKVGAEAANRIVLGISDSSAKLFSGGKKAEGGLIGGTGSTTGDSLVAAVSPGEYVIRASAVRKLGVGYLDALNNISAKRPSGVLPPISRVGRKFAEGGYVDDGGYTPKTVTTNEGNNGGGNVVFNMTFQSLNPEAGAEMMKEQLPFIKNAVVNWMRNDTSVRTATRGAAR